jgi:cold shock protein
MYCTHCGIKLAEDNATCHFCGAARKLETTQSAARSQTGEPLPTSARFEQEKAEQKKKSYDAMLQAIEKGEFPTINVEQEVILNRGEACHMVVRRCAFNRDGATKVYYGDAFITGNRVWFTGEGSEGRWMEPKAVNLYLDRVSSCRVDRLTFFGTSNLPHIAITLEGQKGASRLATGDLLYDNLVAAAILKLASMARSSGAERKRSDAKDEMLLAIERFLRSVFPSTGFQVRRDDSGVIYIAWRGAPDTKYVRDYLRSWKSEYTVPQFQRVFEHDDLPANSGPTRTSGDNASDQSRTRRVQGRVKWLNKVQRYGFITAQNALDVFLHYPGNLGEGFKTLQEGDLVEFEIVQGTHGPMAMRVVKLRGAQTGTRPQETASEIPHDKGKPTSEVASRLKSAFPTTAFEVYSDHARVTHVAWVGTPYTAEVRSCLRGLVLQGQIPNVEFDFQHTDPEKRSKSSASEGKGRTESRAQAKTVTSKGPYEILGVTVGATLDEITHAYRRAAQQNHPDKVAALAPEFRELAERRMKEINAAYEELKRHAK